MWLGAWRSRSDEPLGLTWVKKMNLVPNAALPTKFHSECVSVLSSLHLSDEELNSKNLYKLLLSKE